MHTSRTLIGALGLTFALAIGGAACSTEDQTNAALEKAGVDANVSTGGELPDGFPETVATPDLELESGAAVAGTYTLRYTSSDPAAEIAAYRSALEAAEFTPGGDFTNDAAAGDYQGFTAANADYTVLASAYGPDAPGGGNYLAVVVTPL